ncbi:SDR family NAD(P)-dependent oxidoreductase [Rhodococcus opacus]|uniref:SDR family NAD(P)-dependent oxidoreductase n=1 Tax=Rhodococcus opacus TaxID=37919 RepID=UPI0005C1FE3A|nr:SDR family NAD(P)-dependent oxidoreductase [Rhodococcus opacus]MDJ0419079.1 SDR family NAD(P)-dependent oxidoreductase [Rhodococcus opacus]MDX5965510.1 SDR family NAD(P)-dependent oxidoreductase [Rhodococcus opacus]NKY74021.1 SDR family NAD(P)-dependent oxidoreductase [Rhodococcus opacus]CAG7580151.1 Putative short-chain type dehydrogenase/reductase [Rhodococcus opacus]
MDRFAGQVAIVTGAGGGLGRAHALALAERGVKIIVNDLGDGSTSVVAEIAALGGEAVASDADITDVAAVQAMVDDAVERWGRVDIVINNAGILRDKTFAKMELADFRKVIDVHLMGSVHCTQAVWPHMVAQGYGRILMTTSASGIYGNFGQANYGAAKSALVGLTNVLAIEGERRGIRVNALAPTAATQMTDGLIPEEAAAKLGPETIAPGAVFLVSPDAPNGVILGAGAGVFAVSRMLEARPVFLPEDERTAETIAARWDEIADMSDPHPLGSAFDQTNLYVELSGRASADTLS